jgi:hypothetical protein
MWQRDGMNSHGALGADGNGLHGVGLRLLKVCKLQA